MIYFTVKGVLHCLHLMRSRSGFILGPSTVAHAGRAQAA